MNEELFFTQVIPALYICICAIGIVANFLVIYVLIRYSSKRSIPNIFILNLAIADFLFLCTLPLQAHRFATKRWIFGNIACKIVTGFDGMNQLTGIFILTCMSIDRHMAIVHPIKCRLLRTANKARVISLAVWLASLLASQPLWIFANDYQVSNTTSMCIILWPTDVNGDTVFIVITFILGFILPLFVISICYYKMFAYLRHSHRPSHSARTYRQSRRVALIVVVIVAVFFLCWLPFYILNFVTLISRQGRPSMAMIGAYAVSICLSYANSCLNPIIYSFMGTTFRRNMRKVFLIGFFCRSNGLNEITSASFRRSSSR
ncbi:somatostatin receptor type 2-like [Ptychodera flava]|uniref:somatostatin receptor type 2-like n=1 Tax=Ptychodera flava TaxID=63121 RepID=UPI00396A033C